MFFHLRYVPTIAARCPALLLLPQPTGPLYHFNKKDNEIVDEYTGTFFLNSSMYIEDNTLLDITSPAYGGDASRLLLVRTTDCCVVIFNTHRINYYYCSS